MLTHPLFDQLKTLRCQGMLEALQEQLLMADINRLSFDERFGLLLERECILRDSRRLTNRLRQARLKIVDACLEDVDYQSSRGLSKMVLNRLSQCQWVSRKENVLITGPTGIGKTYLGCAFANQACRQGFSARYVRLPKLLQTIVIAKGDGTYIKMMELLAKTSLLILDDWGVAPMTDCNRRGLLELRDDRYNHSSTVITSQLPVSLWHESIGDATLGDAILDRLVHNAHRIELAGDSMRKTRTKKSDEEKE
ncbi:MAG: IS21-like element helper ATPase IstB [Legionellales bacterium]|nr:IS21-like element helper ATPase IstB [Legionellales bacterium]